MKRLTPVMMLTVFALALAMPAFAQQTTGGEDETSENISASFAAAAAATPGTVAGGVTSTHLLITEVGWRGLNSATLTDSTEFVEIYNPTTLTVDLSKYYLADVNGYSALPVAGTVDIQSNSTDFAFKFPTGSLIGPGAVKVVAIDGGRWKRGVGTDADFMMFDVGNGATTAQSMVDVATNKPAGWPGTSGNGFGMLTNSSSSNGEFVWLFFWDGVSDLVCDVDLVYWGTASGGNLPVDKLATTCQDGPDAGTGTTCYNADTGTFSSANGLGNPANGSGTRQRSGPEGAEASNGNGCVPGGPTATHHTTWGQLKTQYH